MSHWNSRLSPSAHTVVRGRLAVPWSISRAFLLCGTALACSASEPGPGSEVHRTRAPGGWDVVTYSDLPQDRTAELSSNLQIGSLDGEDGGFIFGDVRGIEMSPEGELLVLDHQASEVHAFDLEGNHLGLRYGTGEGPREVAEANGLFFDRDQALWINDHGKMRLTRLLSDGEVETYPFPLGRYGYLWKGTVAADGRLWHDLTMRDPDAVRPEPGYYEATSDVGVLAVDPESGVRDSLRIGTSTVRGIALERGFAGAPFAPARLTAFDPAGSFWTMESSDRYHLTRIDLATGDTLVQVELPVQGPPVLAEERAVEIQRIEEFMERAGRVEVNWSSVLPDRKPVAYQLSVDDESRVWVLRQREEDGRWAVDVIGQDGTYLKTWLLAFEPSRYYVPVIRDQWIFTLRTGEFDEQYVVGSRLREG
jgi:streptogramin lyase